MYFNYKIEVKKYLYILLILFTISCDDTLFNAGETVTKNIEISYFDKIYVEDIFDIHLIQDTVCKIEVKAGRNLIPNLEFTVDEDKNLTINNNNTARWSRDYDKIELYISADTLWWLQLNAPSKITCQNTLITPELKILSLDDYAEININVNCGNFYFVNSGTSGGVLNLVGEANTSSLRARASFIIHAEDFIAKETSVNQESIADCWVYASQKLIVKVLNSGNIYYKGNPETIVYENDKAKSQLFKMN